MIIRDDCSTDNTTEIINCYEKKHKEKIKIIRDNLGNLGCSKCFMELLKYSEADYLMFCDQDDIWLQHKIITTLKKMMELEKIYGRETPIMVFTDLKVVNEKLNVVSESLWKYQKLNPENSKNWKMLIAHNVITGCTIMINRKGKEVAMPFGLPIMNHDHWLGVNISKHGIVDYIDDQTILYKQHGRNTIGGHNFNIIYIIKNIIDVKKFLVIMKAYYKMSKYFGAPFQEVIFFRIKLNLLRLIR